jgi:2-oxoglutarate dehydrogenase E2 component (dihydrolipoamide succinyltransferase)
MEILLPKMGESVAEATIIRCLAEEGQRVEADEALIEIATDKVDSEVPAPEDGTLVRWLVAEGDVVQVGQPIAEFQLDGESAGSPASAVAAAPTVSSAAPAAEVVAAVAAPLASSEAPGRISGDRFYSPLVRSMAAAEGIGQTELDGITGSGLEGRVTKHDMQGFIDSRGSAPAAPKPAAPAAPKPAAPAASRAPVITSGQDQIVEMDRMRKLIAAHMVTSVQTSPHVTSFVEADVTRIVQWRKKNKDEFMRRTGQKLTFTPFFIEAVARALRDFPGVNAQVDGDKIIMRGNINVGMAAATPQGNLIVPVIHNADQLNLVGLAEKVNELAGKARAGKLTADDMAGGTYTVSNVGTFGNVMGTPIINMPQVAILALGAIRKQPAVVEMPEGDVIAIRHRMFLSHSYDHRVVDGQLGGSFVRRVGDYLESFDLDRPIG